jgi:hypothetical protein
MTVDESLITRCAGKDASVYRRVKIKDMRTEVCGAGHTSGSGAVHGAAFSIIRPMLQYQTIPVTPFQQNCSLVWDDQSHQAAVVDPGGDLDLILDAVRQHGLKLEQIWITHGSRLG